MAMDVGEDFKEMTLKGTAARTSGSPSFEITWWICSVRSSEQVINNLVPGGHQHLDDPGGELERLEVLNVAVGMPVKQLCRAVSSGARHDELGVLLEDADADAVGLVSLDVEKTLLGAGIGDPQYAQTIGGDEELVIAGGSGAGELVHRLQLAIGLGCVYRDVDG